MTTRFCPLAGGENVALRSPLACCSVSVADTVYVPGFNRNNTQEPEQSNDASSVAPFFKVTCAPARYCAPPFENSTRTGYAFQRGSSCAEPMPVHTVSTPFLVVGVSMGSGSAAAGQANPIAVPIAMAATAQYQNFTADPPCVRAQNIWLCGNGVAKSVARQSQ